MDNLERKIEMKEEKRMKLMKINKCKLPKENLMINLNQLAKIRPN